MKKRFYGLADMQMREYAVIIALCLHFIIFYSITPCSRILLERLTGSELVKKFPVLYGTQMFVTAFTSARHLSLS
jgi:hypothetical protein